MTSTTSAPSSALVAKASLPHGLPDLYLHLEPSGAMAWVADPRVATPFGSMREAARMALRLPARDRAYGLPRSPEIASRQLH